MTKKIENALSIRAVPVSPSHLNEGETRVMANQDQIDTDLDVSRDSIHETLEVSKATLEDLLLIARQSQHPKAYEVLVSAINTHAKVALDLANLQLKKQKLQPKNDYKDEESKNVTNNNIFVGSTAELQKLIDEMKNNKEE